MENVRTDKKFLNIEELSEYLSLSVSKIYKMVEARQIPFNPIPGTRLVRFPKMAIDEWMATHMVKPVS